MVIPPLRFLLCKIYIHCNVFGVFINSSATWVSVGLNFKFLLIICILSGCHNFFTMGYLQKLDIIKNTVSAEKPQHEICSGYFKENIVIEIAVDPKDFTCGKV